VWANVVGVLKMNLRQAIKKYNDYFDCSDLKMKHLSRHEGISCPYCRSRRVWHIDYDKVDNGSDHNCLCSGCGDSFLLVD